MGSLTRLIIFLSIFATLTLKAKSQYLLPITKHELTNRFYTTLNFGSAIKSPVNLLLDLETNLTLLNCLQVKPPLTVYLVPCQSSTCKSIPGNDCDGLACLYRQSNFLGQNVTGPVVQDTVNISTIDDDGKFLAQVSVDPFTFSCTGRKPFQALPPPIAGVLALSPGSSSFTKQVTSFLRVIPKFSLCLPSSGTGHFYIAAVHYFIPPFNGSDNPIPMTFTPLENIDSGNYLIYIISIYVDGTPLSLNPNLLKGGAKLSTVVPYTVLHTDIYNALAQSFTLKAKKMGISKVQAIAPFKDCFDARAAGMSMTGPSVPVIDIGVPGRGGEVKWRFHGANIVVNVTETVMCLAFLDGGKKPEELMVVGTHQLQDYMIEIDFSASLLAFSDSLLLHNSSCSTWPSQNRINHT